MEEIIVKYNILVDQAKQQLNGIADGIRGVDKAAEDGTKKTSKAVNDLTDDYAKAAAKRKQLVKEETQDLRELEKERKKAFTPEQIKQFNQRIQETQQRIKLLKGEMSGVTSQGNALTGIFGKIGAAAAGAFALTKVSEFLVESAKVAIEAEGIERAFSKLNKPTLLKELREQTKGTVSDLELMRAAVKANNFQVPLEKLGTFFRFATQRSRETGESVQYLVESIVNGIGRKSALVLDNLGISVVRTQEEFKKTGDFGQAAANIIEQELAKAGDATDITADKVGRLSAAFDNLQLKVGKKLKPAIDFAADGAANFIETISTGSVEMAGARYGGIGAVFALLAGYLNDANEGLETFQSKLAKFDSAEQFIVTIGHLSELMPVINSQFGAGGKEAAALTAAIDLVSKALDNFNKKQEESGKSAIRNVAFLKAAIEEQNTILNDATQTREQNKATAAEIEKLQKELNDLLGKGAETAKIYAGSIAQLEKELQAVKKTQAELNITTLDGQAKYAELQVSIERVTKLIERLKDAFKKIDVSGITKDLYDAAKAANEFGDALNEALKPVDLGDPIGDNFKKRQEALKAFKDELKSTIADLGQSFVDLFSFFAEKEIEQSNRAYDRKIELLHQENAIQESLLQNQLQQGQITDEQFIFQRKKLNNDLLKLEDEKRRAEIVLQRKAAIAKKAEGTFNATINFGEALTKATTYGPLAPALIAIATATFAASLLKINAAPLPQFADGVVGFKGKGTGRSDSNLAMISNGESVITAKATRDHKDALKAMNLGEYEKFVNHQYILPAIEKANQRQKSQERKALAGQIALQLRNDNTLVVDALRKNKNVRISNEDSLAFKIAKGINRSNVNDYV